MRTLVLAAAVALLGACEGGPTKKPPTEIETRNATDARAAFEKWVDVTLKGDVDAHYELLSYGFVSQWVFQQLKGEDPAAHAWRASLAGTRVRTGLDLWWEYCRKKFGIDERPELLPQDVFADPSVKALYTKAFTSHYRVELQNHLSKLTISQVAPDAGAVTILVKTPRGLQGCAVAFDRGEWRVDGWQARGGGSPR